MQTWIVKKKKKQANILLFLTLKVKLYYTSKFNPSIGHRHYYLNTELTKRKTSIWWNSRHFLHLIAPVSQVSVRETTHERAKVSQQSQLRLLLLMHLLFFFSSFLDEGFFFFFLCLDILFWLKFQFWPGFNLVALWHITWTDLQNKSMFFLSLLLSCCLTCCLLIVSEKMSFSSQLVATVLVGPKRTLPCLISIFGLSALCCLLKHGCLLLCHWK